MTVDQAASGALKVIKDVRTAWMVVGVMLAIASSGWWGRGMLDAQLSLPMRIDSVVVVIDTHRAETVRADAALAQRQDSLEHFVATTVLRELQVQRRILCGLEAGANPAELRKCLEQ